MKVKPWASETPRTAAVPLSGDAQRAPGLWERGREGQHPLLFFFFFCRCRVIYDMREREREREPLSGPILYFFRGLCLSSQTPAVLLLLYGCYGAAPRAAAMRGSAGEGCPPRPDPSGAPSPLPQPSGPADVPRAWE